MTDRVTFDCRIEKADDGLRTVYGWASIFTLKGRPVTDVQGDQIEAMEVVKAAHSFVSDARVGKRMHKGAAVGEVVESLVFTAEVQKALGIDLGFEGWFIGMKVHDDEVYKAVKAGKLKAFSIGGRAKREKVG